MHAQTSRGRLGSSAPSAGAHLEALGRVASVRHDEVDVRAPEVGQTDVAHAALGAQLLEHSPRVHPVGLGELRERAIAGPIRVRIGALLKHTRTKSIVSELIHYTAIV